MINILKMINDLIEYIKEQVDIKLIELDASVWFPLKVKYMRIKNKYGKMNEAFCILFVVFMILLIIFIWYALIS